MWNSRLRATALPSTSARSQAPMAISHISQLGQRVHAGYQSRQHCARSLPVTTPRRAEMTCMKIAMRLASADDPEQSVFELSARLEVGAPVAGIHVADADENRGADEGAPLLPEAGFVVRDLDGAVDVFEGDAGDAWGRRFSRCVRGIHLQVVSVSILRDINYS